MCLQQQYTRPCCDRTTEDSPAKCDAVRYGNDECLGIEQRLLKELKGTCQLCKEEEDARKKGLIERACARVFRR